MDPSPRFRDEQVALAGVAGEDVEVETANPRNYRQAIEDALGCDRQVVDAKLFVPAASGRVPCVIVVPGSLGVGPNHRAHAETLVEHGHGVLLLDPFGARSVVSTVANQTPYSFAASAFDVLSALALLADHDAIDPARISAQGHSRGGSAVLTASMRRFADSVVGAELALAGAYAVYPWCGHQFRDARVGATRVRAIVGDRDDWLSVQQVQAQIHAIQLAGGHATIRIVAGAAHSFDRREEPHVLPEASVAPHAPTIYLDDDGSMIDPYSGTADPDSTDRDGFVAAVEAGFGRRGATIGGVGVQPSLFRDDMVAFHGRIGVD